MKDDDERRVDEGMDKSHVECYLVSHGLLGILKVPMPVGECHQEEGTPEEEVGDGHDEEHLHPGHPLPVDPLQVVLHLRQIFQ